METLLPFAREGSVSALAVLAAYAQEAWVFSEILPVVCDHINHNPAPSNPEYPISGTSLAVVVQCFKVLSRGFNKETCQDPGLGSTVAALCPRACKWLLFSIRHYLLNPLAGTVIGDDSLGNDLISAITSFFSFISEIPPLLFIIVNHPGFARTITEAWLFAFKHDHPIRAHVSHIITTVSKSAEPGVEQWKTEHLHTLETSPLDVVSITLDNIVTSLQETQRVRWMFLEPNLTMMIYCFSISTTLRYRYLASNSVPWTCRLMRHFCSHRVMERMSMDQGGLELRLGTGLLCLSSEYLMKTFYENYTWVAQALQCHLLQTLIRCQPFVERFGDADNGPHTLKGTFTALIDKINTFLLYRPVTRQARKALDRIECLEVSGWIDSIPESDSLGLAWTQLKKAVASRWNTRDYHVSEQDNLECMNDECTRIGMYDSLMCCAGCYWVYYCSKKCQKASWPSHKEECQDIRTKRRTGQPIPPSHRDLEFIREIVADDIQNHKIRIDALKKQFLKKHPSRKKKRFPLPLVLEMNYRDVSLEISVSSMDKYRYEDSWQYLLDESLLTGGAIVHMSLPCGPDDLEHLDLVHAE